MSKNVSGEVNSISTKIQWTIDNSIFKSSTKAGELLFTSPKFTITTANSQVQCYLLLYPKGKWEGLEEYYSIFLAANKTFLAEVSFKCIHINSEIIWKHAMEGKAFGEDGWGYSKFILRKFIELPADKSADKGKLTIICKIALQPFHQKETTDEESADSIYEEDEDITTLL